jgi:hypothetical protein
VTPTLVYDAARELLAYAATLLNASAGGAPAARFVSDGNVALDCDQLVVEFEELLPLLPGGETQAIIPIIRPVGNLARSARFTIWVTRCAPTLSESGTAPTPTEIDNSARQVLKDLWVLFEGLATGYLSGALFAACQGFALLSGTLQGPEGGLKNAKMTVAVQL